MKKRDNPCERFLKHPTSRKFAIHAHCYECVGRDSDPYQSQISNCELKDCALWAFRPYQKRKH